MSGFELNKVFAAILCAGITIMLTGFIADQIIASEDLKQNAVAIEGADAEVHAASASAKPKSPDPIMALLASADTQRGAKLSKACAACHSFNSGGPTKLGPNIWNIVGSPKGEVSGFAYSKGLKAIGGKWDYDSLNKFLAKPKKFIPGTKMNFPGMKKAQDRAAMIAWLRTKSSAPAPLPTESEIAAEQAAFAPEPEIQAEAEAGSETNAAETAPEEKQPTPSAH